MLALRAVARVASRNVRALATAGVPMDGNAAAAHVGYGLSDSMIIYPITPSSNMGEHADQWAAQARKNVFGDVPKVVEMQSEGGAAGALHGALAAGSLCTTFTASQGLLLMYPNLFKLAGELLPGVVHVAARAIAGQALSIFGDHNDVMSVRAAGTGLLSSGTVQEAMDFAAVAHMASLAGSLPFIHFFEGFRVSHEITTIDPISYDQLGELVDPEAIARFRAGALNPEHPHMRGTSQDPSNYFQLVEAVQPHYDALPAKVEAAFDKLAAVTGRKYGLFEYVGHPEAENVVVMMGCGAVAAEQAMNHLIAKGEKVGLIKVRLFRPFRVDKMLEVLPESVKRISVLDRTKEAGAIADPLYLDTFVAVNQHRSGVQFYGGRYGLGSKEFTPGMALSVFDNMRAADPKPHFVVGITEDVGNRSLPTAELDVSALLPKGTQEAMFWGLGSDGTVGANHTAIELLVKEGKQFGQGYFSYSAHKSGGLTCSHLRFGPEQFQAPYMLQAADYVGCHFTGYIQKYGARLIQDIKEGGSFVINSPWKSAEETAANLPAAMKRLIAERDIKLYTIDANAIAADCGIAGRINMIMQAVFFSLSTVMPAEESLGLLRKECEHMFGKMGSAMVEMNQAALDQAVDNVIVLDYDKAAWAAAKDSEDPAQLKRVEAEKTEFVETVVEPMADLRGDELPVSAFSGAAIGGKLPPGVTKYEKRAIADAIPVWDPEECTQCNKCATACPHAVIRPFLLSKSAGEVAAKPEGFLTLPAKPFGLAKKATKDFEFSMQVSAFDCTGCTVCAKICPEDGALTMTSFHPEDDKAKATVENWAYAMSLPSREDLFLPGKNKMAKTLKAQQFKTPLLEFSGACQGCAETPIVKLVTQMYGSQMLVANATGCSSIWAGSYPMNPYTVNSEGHGPAWGNSLFEDNAEYGFGMHVASTSRRESLLRKVEAALEVGEASGELATALQGWVAAFDDLNASKAAATEVKAALAGADSPFAAELAKDADMLAKKSQWIFGGDGWAYDIGFGGLDHVLASGEDVNVVVFDTEVYSNTGGQCSKSTPRGGVAKFSTHGKPTAKKDLGRIAMTYGNVYVASVSMGADESHLVKVMQEAAEYPGPSLVLSYSPCIAHGVKGGLKNQIPEQRLAVESGYWNLYRYDPRRAEAGENPFQLDYDPDTSLVEGFMDKEARFTSLRKDAPEVAEERLGGLAEDVRRRADVYRELAKEE